MGRDLRKAGDRHSRETAHERVLVEAPNYNEQPFVVIKLENDVRAEARSFDLAVERPAQPARAVRLDPKPETIVGGPFRLVLEDKGSWVRIPHSDQ